ncbi:MAG: VanZ family protein [Gemmatimonadaceae bacterium]
MSARRWLPPVLWAALILVLTSIPSPPEAPGGIPHLDKVVHLLMYAGLGWLVGRALRTRRPIALAGALAAIAIFGGLDEWHQGFFTRTPDLVDWVADVFGASLGLMAASRVYDVEPAS